MKTMIISDFKAKCIATLKEVEESKETVVVTLRGRSIAEVVPVSAARGRVLGRQKGCMMIKGDIMHSDSANEWSMCTEGK